MVERKWIVALVGGMLAWPGFGWAQMPAPVAGDEIIGTPELVQKACAEGQVIYYTPDSETQSRAITAVFEKRFPCIRVLTVSAVSGRLIERIAAESAATKIQADVVLLNDLQALTKFKDTGVIRPWTPPTDDKYPATAKLAGWWYGAGGTMDYIVYNTNLVSAADAPKTWQDILDPKWKGKIAAGTVSLGGTAWLQYYFFHQKYGDDFLKKLAAQQPRYFTSYQPLTLAVARGELAIALTCISVEAPMRIVDGAPLKAVYPADGIPVVPAWMVLMSHSPHPDAALLYANWATSREGQEAQVRARMIWSQRPDVPAAEGNPPASSMNFWNLPADVMIREYADFTAKAAHILGQE